MTEPHADTMAERLRAALSDRYAVEQKLGEGGMAFVYLARDLKHDRLVAIKVLRPDLAASIGADRFLKEIHNTAKLSHPHILPLYDSGEAEGILFYVMPFVEGESLNDFIKREKQLSIGEAVKITREVAEALSHAHSYGLIHRDIKPDNIMMSGGHAIVADFGISKALSEAGGDQLTQTGTSVGTPAYMSPEQAMGSPDIDGRSDIYSLGCVLYQMLVGDIPFTGPTAQAIMARHTMDQLTPPSIMRDTIPAELEDVIYTAMAKTPADRYRTAQELAEALAALEAAGFTSGRQSAMHRLSQAQQLSGIQTRPGMRTVGGPTPATPQTPVPSLASTPAVAPPAWRRAMVPAGVVLAAVVGGVIVWQFAGRGGTPVGTALEGGLDASRVAVLYFEDRTRDESLGYVADGLTEGLIERLAQVPQLSVVSRNGVAPYRAATIARDSIARALEVGSLVMGSVEPAGDRIRITVRLVDGLGGAEIESRAFELPGGELLAARDSAAEVASGFLRARLGEQVRLREWRSSTTSVEAWSLVQRAERLRKVAEEERDAARANELLAEADSLLRIAQSADPDWAEPTVLRGWTAYARAGKERDRYQRVPILQEALQHAEQAVTQTPSNAEALELRGILRWQLYQHEASTDPTAQARLLDAAQRDLDQATRTDPSRAQAWLALSRLHYERKDNVSALLAARRAYEADAFLRNQDANLMQLFWTHYDLEQFPDAARWCNEGARRFGDDFRFALCQLWMMTTPQEAPNVERAWRLVAQLDSLAPAAQREYWNHLGRIVVGGILARAELRDSARSVLVNARAGREIDPEQELPAYEAIMRVLLGDYDEAAGLLRQYVAVNPGHEFNVGRDLHWWWRPLRDHPGFRAVTTQTN